jgi:transcriptional regulator with XRE-family HTH domain
MNVQKLLEQDRGQKALGERIRKLRLKKGWSQKITSDLSGISVRTIAQIERGEFEVRLSTLLAIAEAFRITVSHLLRGLP